MTERINVFTVTLEEIKSTQENLKALSMLLKKEELNNLQQSDILIKLIIKEIKDNCNYFFVKKLQEQISEKVSSVNMFDSDEINYLQYLAQVIFHTVSGIKPPIGLNMFIVPGVDYKHGEVFCSNHHQDFEKIHKLFGITSKHCPEVKIGYACEFVIEKRIK